MVVREYIQIFLEADERSLRSHWLWVELGLASGDDNILRAGVKGFGRGLERRGEVSVHYPVKMREYIRIFLETDERSLRSHWLWVELALASGDDNILRAGVKWFGRGLERGGVCELGNFHAGRDRLT